MPAPKGRYIPAQGQVAKKTERCKRDISCSRDRSPLQGSTFAEPVTQGCGDTASKERSPAASTLG
ncbi:hypothetical protein AciX8_3059 [Granulicella mallensis MP5ACTX8]|uniref:Uncharacterized protein n=1 Tax=Granulicella mallensis (strain ATCC BAA-1857 / DSM 23137 / MP5ACTX8) TaxID=682795 RepID=G8NRK4_GRAMM|nr:hypothetical protein AciX8_3059 [Granulicella mallensis MP5ACTX8]